MIAFEKAVDGLNHIRMPITFESESKEVQIPEDSQVPEQQYRRYGVVFVRAEKSRESFSELRLAMILAEIHLGLAASNALNELWSIRHEVIVAAGALANREQDFYNDTPEDAARRKSNNTFYNEQKAKLYNLGASHKDDTVAPRIEKARKDLKEACRPYFELPGIVRLLVAVKLKLLKISRIN